MTESTDQRGARSADRGAETEKTGGGRGRENGTGVRPPPSPSSLESYATVLREALSHALGAAHIRPPQAGSDLHVALWHLAKSVREAEIELDAIRAGASLAPRSEFRAPSSVDAPGSAFRVPSSPACDVTAEIPPGGQIVCGPLSIERHGIGSSVRIRLSGAVHVDAVFASMNVRIRTVGGRWYPEVQASEADLPLVLTGQGDTQRAIREEDV